MPAGLPVRHIGPTAGTAGERRTGARLESRRVTSSERDPVLGARRSARAVALRRARDVLVLDDGGPDAEPLWARVRERARPDARVRVVALEPPVPSRDGAPGAGAPAVDHRVAPALPLSLVALDDTVVLVARPDRTRAVTDRVAVLAQGRIVVAGPPETALSPDVLRPTYGIETVKIQIRGQQLPVAWEVTD